MPEVEGSRTFAAGAVAYERFMGRYSRELAEPFADLAGIEAGLRVLDVGCGPGAFTSVAVQRAGAESVCAIDPTPGFVESCRQRLPGIDVRQARAEQIPYDSNSFDRAVAQLVLHFVSDPAAAVAEMARVVRPGGIVASCVWDFGAGMEMLRLFWDAAVSVDPNAPDEAQTMRFGRAGELTALLESGGLAEVSETTLAVGSAYADFDELWSSLEAGVGPAGAYLAALSADRQAALREAYLDRLGRPTGEFTLRAVARAARGVRRWGLRPARSSAAPRTAARSRS